MSTGRLAPIALALAAGCADEALLFIEAPAGWAAAVVAIDSKDGQEVTAYAPGAAIVARRPASEDVTVLAAFYDQPLAALGIDPGPVPSTTRTRKLPPPTLGASWRARIAGETTDAEPVLIGDPRLDRVRIPALDSAACGRIGSCLSIRDELRDCTATCSRGPSAGPAEPIPPEPPRAPEAAERPRFLACPDRWTPADGGCVPPAPPPRLACPAGEIQPYDAAACVPATPPCTREWPSPPLLGAVAWVHPAGASAPSGQPAYRTITEALAAAPSGAVIALSRGRHPGGVSLSGGRTILGACAADTVIEASAGAPTLVTEGQGGAIRGVTVETPYDAYAVVVEPGTELAMREVVVHGVVVAGRVEARDLVLRAGGVASRAVWAFETGVAIVDDAVIEGADEPVVADGPAARIELSRTVVTSSGRAQILATRGGALALSSTDLFGPELVCLEATMTLGDVRSMVHAAAFRFERGCVVEAERLVLDRPAADGLWIEGARVTLGDLWISQPGEVRGTPIRATGGATLAIARGTLVGGRWIELADSRVAIADVFMRGTDGPAVVTSSGALWMSRVAIADPSGSALTIERASTASISDVTIERVRDGVGVVATSDARVSARRIAVRDAARGAIEAASGARLEVRDLDAAGAAVPPQAYRGVALASGATLDMSRARLRGFSGVGLEVAGAAAIVRDLEIRDVSPPPGEAARPAIDATSATLTVLRVIVEDVPGASIGASGSTLRIEDLSTRRVLRGVDLGQGTTATVARVRAAETISDGFAVADSKLDARDLWVDNGDRGTVVPIGSILDVAPGSTVDVRRLRGAGAGGVGITINGPDTAVTIEDLTLVEGDQRGMYADVGSTLTLRRALIRDVRTYAIKIDDQATARLFDVEIDRVHLLDAEAYGLWLGRSADVELRRFSIRDTPLAGVRITSGVLLDGPAPRLTAIDGAITTARVGFQLIVPPGLLEQLELVDVVLTDVEIDFETDL